MASDTFCRHYPSGGMGDNTHCKVGVDMYRVREGERPHRCPCYDSEVRHLCAKYEAYTAEEIRQDNEELAQTLKAMFGVMAGTSDTCPHCNAPIEQLRQSGKCVYAAPCGCRQYQGTVPDTWKTD